MCVCVRVIPSRARAPNPSPLTPPPKKNKGQQMTLVSLWLYEAVILLTQLAWQAVPVQQ